MKRVSVSIFILCILGGAHISAYADIRFSEARGQLLYSTHCIACHTSQIHWRDEKLVNNWNSLMEQVRRWQNVAGLGWSEEEIQDVAYYLNTLFYEYKDTQQNKKTK